MSKAIAFEITLKVYRQGGFLGNKASCRRYLVIVFAIRLKKTGKFLLAGIMLMLSVVSLLLMLFA